MESTEVEVEADGAGQRLDRYLAGRLEISRARVRHLLEVGRISRSGRSLTVSDKSVVTEAGARFIVSGSLRAEDERPTPRPDIDWRLVAQGAGWLVVDKPPGCGVHPLRPDQDDTVLNAVIARCPEILGVGEGGLRSGVLHRLDVDTTGALAFAKDENHWKRFRGAFSEHRVSKTYHALVAGKFEKQRRVDLPLEITKHSPSHVAVKPGGRPCRQSVMPVEIFDAATLVEIRLETGFLHQIRATMAHIGHPVIGDLQYHKAAEAAEAAQSDEAELARPGPTIEAPRQLLHAGYLAVDEVVVTVPLPEDFEAVLAELRSKQS